MITEIPQPLSYGVLLSCIGKYGNKLRARNSKTDDVCIVAYQTYLNANELCYLTLVNIETHEILNHRDDFDDFDLVPHWEFYVEGEV